MEFVQQFNAYLMQILSLNHLLPEKYLWMFLLFLVIFLTLLVNFVVIRTLKKLIFWFDAKTKSKWDEILLHALHKPLGWFIWIAGFVAALHILATYSQLEWNNYINHFWRVAIIVNVSWMFIRIIGNIEKEITSGRYQGNLDHSTVYAVGRLLRLSIMITASLIILQYLGFSISGVLAFGGIGGIAIGFAAKDLLSNFFGAIMIFVDKPFAVGDWIRSPDRNIEGTVEDIGWRMTRIRTFDKRPLYVPNSVFSSIAVENPSRMLYRRIKETIGLRYQDLDKLELILTDIRKMLYKHEKIESSQTIIVAFNSYGDFSVNFLVYCFTTTTLWVEYHSIKQRVLLEIERIIHEHGADFAFPTQTLHVENEKTRVEKIKE